MKRRKEERTERKSKGKWNRFFVCFKSDFIAKMRTNFKYVVLFIFIFIVMILWISISFLFIFAEKGSNLFTMYILRKMILFWTYQFVEFIEVDCLILITIRMTHCHCLLPNNWINCFLVSTVNMYEFIYIQYYIEFVRKMKMLNDIWYMSCVKQYYCIYMSYDMWFLTKRLYKKKKKIEAKTCSK